MIKSGWDHNPRIADRGDEVLKDFYYRAGIKEKWFPEEQKGLWSGAPEELNLKTIDRKDLYSTPMANDKAEFKERLKAALNMNETNFTQRIKKDNNFTYTYAIDVDYLVDHLKLDRSKFAGMIAETIKDPQEIRAVFLKSNTGKVAIRHVFYSKFKDWNEDKWVTVVFDANQVRFVSHTVFPKDKKKPKAEGKVIYKKLPD